MNKSIIIYFSRADENYNVGYIAKGNTEVIAEYIQEYTKADMFKVERKNPYAKDYQTCIEEAKEEQNNNEMPELAIVLEDINKYEIVFIGSPIYWGTMPQPMFTQLSKLDWHGKNVRVFTTHEGSGLGNVLNDVNKLCVGANISTNALAIVGSKVNTAKELVNDWLKN